jgi:hypothetical protein
VRERGARVHVALRRGELRDHQPRRRAIGAARAGAESNQLVEERVREVRDVCAVFHGFLLGRLLFGFLDGTGTRTGTRTRSRQTRERREEAILLRLLHDPRDVGREGAHVALGGPVLGRSRGDAGNVRFVSVVRQERGVHRGARALERAQGLAEPRAQTPTDDSQRGARLHRAGEVIVRGGRERVQPLARLRLQQARRVGVRLESLDGQTGGGHQRLDGARHRE